MNGSIGSATYTTRLWTDVPCTVDELARVMTYVDSKDVTPFDALPCPSMWECAPENEIRSAETLPLRFRVMVNCTTRVAFAAFRCTDGAKPTDIQLDAHIIAKSWTNEQTRKVVKVWGKIPCFWDCLIKSGVDLTGSPMGAFIWLRDTVLPGLSPFCSVNQANDYIRDTVQPWAQRKNYTLVVGGYSLGGFIAQYVGYHQNLYNVSFDGLYGVERFLPKPLNGTKISKCVSICYNPDSVISWPQIQIGRVLQITRLGQAAETHIINNTGMGYMGHSMAFFYDPLNPFQYRARLSASDTSAMYGIRVGAQDVNDFCILHEAAEAFCRGERVQGITLFLRVSKIYKDAVYYQMYLMKKEGREGVWELGMHCFLPGSHHRFSSTSQERAQAINALLINRWRQARGL